jgi:hypothetical protein
MPELAEGRVQVGELVRHKPSVTSQITGDWTLGPGKKALNGGVQGPAVRGSPGSIGVACWFTEA